MNTRCGVYGLVKPQGSESEALESGVILLVIASCRSCCGSMCEVLRTLGGWTTIPQLDKNTNWGISIPYKHDGLRAPINMFVERHLCVAWKVESRGCSIILFPQTRYTLTRGWAVKEHHKEMVESAIVLLWRSTWGHETSESSDADLLNRRFSRRNQGKQNFDLRIQSAHYAQIEAEPDVFDESQR